MSQTNLTFNKRTLTTADFSLLKSYGIRQPGMFAFAYELGPHGTSFSKNVTFQGRSSIYFKVPHPNQASLRSARWGFGNNCVLDSFSIIYESPVAVDSGEVIQLEDFVVTAGSDNSRYTLNGITRSSSDAVRAALEFGPNSDYVKVYAPTALSTMDYISPFIESTPFGTRDSAIFVDVKHPLISAGGNPFGPNDFPVRIATPGQTRDMGSEPVTTDLSWPADFKYLGYYINTSSKFYNDIPSLTKIENVYFQFLFRAFGWTPQILDEVFGENFEVKPSVRTSFPDRRFCTNPAVVDRYKNYIGDKNVFGVPMGYQPGTEHLFAGGFHSDRWDTADFYFIDGHEGGPYDEPVPHPALQGELLSTNSRDSGERGDHDFYTYKRHKFLDVEYYKPNFIVTREALGMIGYNIDDQITSDINIREALYADSEEAPVRDTQTASIIKTRKYTKEKYIIKNNGNGIERHLLVDRNVGINHGGSNGHDKSIIQALRYFGFIPFGIATPKNVYPGSTSTAIVVENGDKKQFINGMKIKGGVSVFPVLYDFHIFISANATAVHDIAHERGQYKGKDLNFITAVGLLKQYFMAQPIRTVIDVGDERLDLESDASFSAPVEVRSKRYVLTMHPDFNP